MSNLPAVLLAVALAACGGAPAWVEVSSGADLSPTRVLIDHYIADGANPAAFTSLAGALDHARDTANREVLDDSELRLLALAGSLVNAVRSAPLERQVDALALTVWPVLLAEPLTAPRSASATVYAPIADESAAAYFLRMCSGPLATECGASTEVAVVVRAIAVHRANLRVHEALATYLHGGADEAQAWNAVAYRWESLDRAMTTRVAPPLVVASR